MNENENLSFDYTLLAKCHHQLGEVVRLLRRLSGAYDQATRAAGSLEPGGAGARAPGARAQPLKRR
ncbi:hypothetical protein WME75_21480 [Sorangium sp. So ce1014]|uniref:hypothetical protein n=1 Tax=Sorangium sp. So ce1014 TaxID=3133326 RepID=UPI003F5F007B